MSSFVENIFAIPVFWFVFWFGCVFEIPVLLDTKKIIQQTIKMSKDEITAVAVPVTYTPSNAVSPVAVAVPVGNAPPRDELYTIDLPVGVADVGIEISGSPLQVSAVSFDSPVHGKIPVGHYIHGLIMPEIEITNFQQAGQLNELLQVNASISRQLLLSQGAYSYDPSVGDPYPTGTLYKHKLPAGADFGVATAGFPPVITHVSPNSTFSGRLHSGQTVVALLVAGQSPMNLSAGAFTSARMQQRIAATAHIAGRQMIVRDGSKPYKEKGSDGPFDDCIIM